MTEDQKKNLETQLWGRACPLGIANLLFGKISIDNYLLYQELQLNYHISRNNNT